VPEASEGGQAGASKHDIQQLSEETSPASRGTI